MPDQMANQTTNDEDDETPVSELDHLKRRATQLGLTFSNNIGLETLRNRVNARLGVGDTEDLSELDEADEADEADETEIDEMDADEDEEAPVSVAPAGARKVRAMTAQEREIELRGQQRAEQLRLVRVRIANMNPAKRDLQGEIFTVANRYLGIVKKFIPYGEATDEGYHIPYVLYEELRNRKFLQIKTRKDPKKVGHIIVDQRWVPEFNLEVLPPLTPAELAQLARQQAAARGMGE
jgi:hypothetical protein